ncbi:MAG: hypothetical protein KJO97_14345 [Acidimicrobiia bacterium]|nr:hypothetical protein [Acidimicrobiia bacterium]
MTDELHPTVARLVHQLAEAAPPPLTYADLLERDQPQGRMTARRTTWKLSMAAGVAVLLAVAIPVLFVVGDAPRTGAIAIERGALITNVSLDGLFDVRDFVPDPEGDRIFRQDDDQWCVIRISRLPGLEGDPSVQAGGLAARNAESACIGAPFRANARWSPNGDRLLLYQQNDPTGTYRVVDAEMLELVHGGNLGSALQAVMIDSERILHFSDGPSPAWKVSRIEGEDEAVFEGPAPAPTHPPLLTDEATVVYRSVEGELIRIDLADTSAASVARLPNLNPGGFSDVGTLVGVTPDASVVLLLGTEVANRTGSGPTAFIYDPQTDVLVPHVPAGLPATTRTFIPSIVGDEWVTYTVVPDLTSGDSSLNVYVAPLLAPERADLVFSEGTLVVAAGNRLFIRAGDVLAVLEVDP